MSKMLLSTIKKMTNATKFMVLGLLLMLTLGVVAEAKVTQKNDDVYFEKHFIDDNTYTKVVSGNTNSVRKKIQVKVTKMRDENGKVESSWNYTWWKVNKAGKTFSNETRVTKGDDNVYLILDQRVSTSDTLVVKAHGNKKDLDAKIDGYIYAFTKD